MTRRQHCRGGALAALLLLALAACQGATPISLGPTETVAASATSTQPPTATASPQPTATLDSIVIQYTTQAGDSLAVLSARFGVEASEIQGLGSAESLSGLLDPGQVLTIPVVEGPTTPGEWLLPDSEVIFSVTASDFNLEAYVAQAGGFLGRFESYYTNAPQSGAKEVAQVALDYSINPRLLLALLEYQSGIVLGELKDSVQLEYLLGMEDWRHVGLRRQLIWAAEQLSVGYYGWREGSLTTVTFPDSTTLRLDPSLNAGTVALQFLFAQLYPPDAWDTVLDPEDGFLALHQHMFGDPWARAAAIEPLFPPGLTQPSMNLPFAPGDTWWYTSGPHSAWGTEGARAALDFTPPTAAADCRVSLKWALAATPGLVVRSGNGTVVLDLDGDGDEHTGWVLVYVHIATDGRVAAGTWLEADDPIGHPSCEGGPASSTHLHIVRKYNGEWMLAGGALPFTMSGWTAVALPENYTSTLVQGEQIITACRFSCPTGEITRTLEP